MIILLPVLVTLVGLLVYLLATRGDVKELGRIAFAVGLLVTILRADNEVFHVFSSSGSQVQVRT